MSHNRVILVAAFELNNLIKVEVCDGDYGRHVKFVLEEPGKERLWINLSRYVWQKLDAKMEEVAKATQELQRNGDRREFSLNKTDSKGRRIFVRVTVVNGLTHVSVCQREVNGLKAVRMDMEAWTSLVVDKGLIDNFMGPSTPAEQKLPQTAPGAPKRRRVAEPFFQSTPKLPRIDAQMPRVLDYNEPEEGGPSSGASATQFKWILRSSDDILIQQEGVWTYDEDFAVKAGEKAKNEYISEDRNNIFKAPEVVLLTREVGMPEDLHKSCYAYLIYAEITRMAKALCEGCQNGWDSQMDHMGFYGHMAPLYERVELYYKDAEKAVSESAVEDLYKEVMKKLGHPRVAVGPLTAYTRDELIDNMNQQCTGALYGLMDNIEPIHRHLLF
jgi:hypothetical protein